MNLVSLIVALLLLGLALYIISVLPIDGTIKLIIRAVAIVVAVLWVLQAMGLLSGMPFHLR